MTENKIINEARQYLYGQNTSNDQIQCHTLQAHKAPRPVSDSLNIKLDVLEKKMTHREPNRNQKAKENKLKRNNYINKHSIDKKGK